MFIVEQQNQAKVKSLIQSTKYGFPGGYVLTFITAFSCWYFLEDVSYLWEEGGGFTKNILSYLENVIFDLGREGLKANFGNVMIYAGIFHGNRPLASATVPVHGKVLLL